MVKKKPLELKFCKIITIKNILDSLPSKTILKISMLSDITICHTYKLISLMSKQGLVKYKKIGRSKHVVLTNEGKRLKETLRIFD